jgi:hypothetical protein
MKKFLMISTLCAVGFLSRSLAQTTWDGGGGTDTSWGNATNWDNNTLPAFNGTDSLTVTTGFGGNTSLTLGADRSIGRLTFGGGLTAVSLNGNTLQLNSTTTSAGAGTALWNANTNDNVQATVNSNILLQSGTAGSYTGYFRENNNSNGGTKFNGSITQGAGESWTLRFSRSGARGTFVLNNSTNSISAIRNDGADVFSETIGSFGGAALTLSGGFTGARINDHYTTAVNNAITVVANSQWASQIQTRLTGAMSQGSNTLTYGFSNTGANGNGALTRLEFSSYSGTGTTVIIGGALSTSSMSNISSGALDLGATASSSSVIVLSGSSGNGVPTWSDFAASKTYNQAGGAGTWRINAGTTTGNTGNFGGFAARGADLIIPSSGGGLSNSTFSRNFQLGSTATLDGAQYASNAVIIQTDIAYGEVAGANRQFGVAANQGSSKTTTQLTLTGPVHELSGQITGNNVIMYPNGLSNTQMSLVRISNASNSLTGTSRWILGGNRSSFTTLGGGVIAAGANAADLSSIVAIFTSDGAFGGATEVNVASQNSSSQNTSGTLLFEDTNGSGSTTFTQNINLQNISQASVAPAWGSYGGDVIYTGTATLGGSGNLSSVSDSIIHVQAGTLRLGVAGGSAATITNNRTAATRHNKSGNGTLYLDNLVVNGTQATNSWDVRAGLLAVNVNLTGNVTVYSGGSLGGNGTVGATTVQSGGTLTPGNSPGLLTAASLVLSGGSFTNMEIDGVVRGTGYDAVDVTGSLTYGGALTLDFGTTFGAGNYTFNLFDFSSQSGNFTSVALGGSYSGNLVNTLGVWSYTDIGTGSSWTFTQSTGDLAFTSAIPEPSIAALSGLGILLALKSRIRRRKN